MRVCAASSNEDHQGWWKIAVSTIWNTAWSVKWLLTRGIGTCLDFCSYANFLWDQERNSQSFHPLIPPNNHILTQSWDIQSIYHQSQSQPQEAIYCSILDCIYEAFLFSVRLFEAKISYWIQDRISSCLNSLVWKMGGDEEAQANIS